jgi:hypothetical protein
MCQFLPHGEKLFSLILYQDMSFKRKSYFLQLISISQVANMHSTLSTVKDQFLKINF